MKFDAFLNLYVFLFNHNAIENDGHDDLTAGLHDGALGDGALGNGDSGVFDEVGAVLLAVGGQLGSHDGVLALHLCCY